MKASPVAPGLYYEATRQAEEMSALRSDISGFAGPTERGPVGVPIRVVGWRECQLVFGGLLAGADTPLALQGYFDNGGDVAYVVRLLGIAPSGQPADLVAHADWNLCKPDGDAAAFLPWASPASGVPGGVARLVASSPGGWANGLRVTVRMRLQNASGLPELDMTLRNAGDTLESMTAIDPFKLGEALAQRSRFIRLLGDAPVVAPSAVATGTPPRMLSWPDIVLGGGGDPPAMLDDYQHGLQNLLDEAEVALLAFPDLAHELSREHAASLQQQAIVAADALHERIALLDLPFADADAAGVVNWARTMRTPELGGALRAAAVYHPWLSVRDPFGGIENPLRTIAPCGHIAGVISRMDRERGAHYTPANTTVAEAMDVAASFTPTERGTLNEAGINLLRCVAGQGIQIWGGRTLLTDDQLGTGGQRFLANRRLIHRLIRAIRRVAEPLVFECNGPVLWLTLSRAVTTVLLESYRAGGLQGSRPEEAFQVHCDATNNPPEAIDRGEAVCEIQLAPATPMEFITLRVILSSAGSLDIFEN